MSDTFDIAVIGSGPGGYVAALKAAQMGARTAIIEQHPFFGGTCLNWGCIPSKALLATSELVHRVHSAGEYGVNISGQVSVDWGRMQSRKDGVLKTLRGGIKGLLGARKVSTFHGRGRIDGAGRIVVAGKDGDTQQLAARNIILATGSVPTTIPGWPTDCNFVCTSDEALHWKDLPRRVLIVGGGVIGCEFACMLQPLGVEVTIVEMLPRLLGPMDESLASELAKVLKSRGIRIITGVKIQDVAVKDDRVIATLGDGQTLEVDRVLVSVGRKPVTKDIGLESVGISAGDRGFLQVNDRMETAIPGVYAIGDVNGQMMLAHAASAHGVTAVETALGAGNGFHAPIPQCVYTFPEVAGVGITEATAREQGLPISIGRFPLGHLGKALAAGEPEGFVKVVRHRETDELLGVHMIGHSATEVIMTASVLLHHRVAVHDIVETVFAHPTISESIREASEDALGMGLHLPPRKLHRVTGDV